MKCSVEVRLLQFFVASILRRPKEMSKENELVAQGAQTLLHRHKAMHTCKFANAKISSALHRFPGEVLCIARAAVNESVCED